MKSLVGALAVLFLATTFAVAEGYQPLPFPQAANTALATASAGGQSTSAQPGAMASDQNSVGPIANAASGSPFPSSANPSLRAGTSGESTPALKNQRGLGSPFPSSANPSRNW